MICESVRAVHGRYLWATFHRQAPSPHPHRPHRAHIKVNPLHRFHGGHSLSAGLRLLLDLKEPGQGQAPSC